jgi:serine/threonine protein kinase
MIISIGIDISEGLSYFEKQNLLHKDIKLGNILVCKDLKCKIGFIFFHFIKILLMTIILTGDLGQIIRLEKSIFYIKIKYTNFMYIFND